MEHKKKKTTTLEIFFNFNMFTVKNKLSENRDCELLYTFHVIVYPANKIMFLADHYIFLHQHTGRWITYNDESIIKHNRFAF